ncbi:hypothetical protein [Rhodopila sp.]|uniref:hypothetical protein n=1 Tax=Rhodopila sp. TaxID=2480087 RepID=UPI003D0E62E2
MSVTINSATTNSATTNSATTNSATTNRLHTNLPQAVLETILTRLAALFLAGAGGDPTAARHAAAQMLAAYHPETEDELYLAASVVSFGFQSLEALSQAATPDMPLTRILRLRGGAVTLSRESDKARKRLDQLRNARQQAVPAEPRPEPTQPELAPPEPAQPEPKVAKALDLIQDTAQIAEAAKTSGLTWAQSHEKRQQDERIAASLKRAEARIAAQANATTLGHHSPVPAAQSSSPGNCLR